jgi:two-component system, sensor histidine kinase and response regulator
MPSRCGGMHRRLNHTDMTDSQGIDRAALDRLQEWGGEKLVGQMVRLFLANSGARMDQIRNGASSGDAEEAEKGSHSLKSSAANVGAQKVRSISAAVEAAAASGDLDAVRAMVAELDAAYALALVELESVIQGIPE